MPCRFQRHPCKGERPPRRPPPHHRTAHRQTPRRAESSSGMDHREELPGNPRETRPPRLPSQCPRYPVSGNVQSRFLPSSLRICRRYCHFAVAQAIWPACATALVTLSPDRLQPAGRRDLRTSSSTAHDAQQLVDSTIDIPGTLPYGRFWPDDRHSPTSVEWLQTSLEQTLKQRMLDRPFVADLIPMASTAAIASGSLICFRRDFTRFPEITSANYSAVRPRGGSDTTGSFQNCRRIWDE